MNGTPAQRTATVELPLNDWRIVLGHVGTVHDSWKLTEPTDRDAVERIMRTIHDELRKVEPIERDERAERLVRVRARLRDAASNAQVRARFQADFKRRHGVRNLDDLDDAALDDLEQQVEYLARAHGAPAPVDAAVNA